MSATKLAVGVAVGLAVMALNPANVAEAGEAMAIRERAKLAEYYEHRARYAITQMLEPLLGPMRVVVGSTVSEAGELADLRVAIIVAERSLGERSGDVSALVRTLLPAVSECRVVVARAGFVPMSVEPPQWAIRPATNDGNGDGHGDGRWIYGVGESTESREAAISAALSQLAQHLHVRVDEAGRVTSDAVVEGAEIREVAERIGPRGPAFYARARIQPRPSASALSDERPIPIDPPMPDSSTSPAPPANRPNRPAGLTPEELAINRVMGDLEPHLDVFVRKRDRALLHKDEALISLMDAARPDVFEEHAVLALRNAYEALAELNAAKIASLQHIGQLVPALHGIEIDSLMRAIHVLHNSARGLAPTHPGIRGAFESAMRSDAALFEAMMRVDSAYAERMRLLRTRLEELAVRTTDQIAAVANANSDPASHRESFIAAYRAAFDALNLEYRLAGFDGRTPTDTALTALLARLDALPGSPSQHADAFRARRYYADAARSAAVR